jgi:competence protein CoiA
MKYALVCGKKTEASKGATGACPSCGSELIARCGQVKVNHWAHKGTRNCDPWWENETEWHREWKGHFPIEWQEVVHKSDTGEKHIADVKTEKGWVLEFQHSFINPEERLSRNRFYPKLVWVVDGIRRQRDQQQFRKILEESAVLNQKPLIRKVNFPGECRLVSEWIDSSAIVFFDFRETITEDSALWLMIPGVSKTEAYLMNILCENFIEYHKDERFDKIYHEQILPIRDQLINIKRRKVVYRPRVVPSPYARRRRNFRF